jgi:hypothetical protein
MAVALPAIAQPPITFQLFHPGIQTPTIIQVSLDVINIGNPSYNVNADSHPTVYRRYPLEPMNKNATLEVRTHLGKAARILAFSKFLSQ